MQTDVGTVMVVGTFVLALLVFAGGLVGRFVTGRREGRATPLGSDVTPPPLPSSAGGPVVSAEWIGGNPDPVAPYAPGQAMPPPVPAAVPGRGPERWWKVSSAIYNWYDLPMMLLLVLLYAAAPVAMLLTGQSAEGGVNLATLIGTIVMQFFLTALVMGFVAWRKRPIEWLGLRWSQWRWGFLIAPVAVGMTWMALIVLQLIGYNTWLQGQIGDDGRQEVVKAFGDAEDPLLLGLLCFTAVVVAPVTEEILFRGYLYPSSKRFLGRWAAIAFTALIFSVAHANAMALIPLLLLAVLLTVAYEATGSLWAPIGIHMLFNGITVMIQLAVKFGVISLPET